MSDSPNLNDVKARRGEIANETRSIIARLDSLKQEDRDLEVAERVLARLAGQSVATASPEVGQTVLLQMAPGSGKSRTISDLLVEVLRRAPEPWLTANELQDALSTERGSPVPMSTVSPTLTLLKNKGVVLRDGLRVALNERIDAKTFNEIQDSVLNNMGQGRSPPSPGP